MGFLLDRTLLADWTKDPTVPAPVEPVKAAAQPGAVREGFQGLYSRIFDVLRGRVNFQSIGVNPGKDAGGSNLPANGIQIEWTGGRFIGLTIENAEPAIRVFGGTKNTSINDDSISSNWGFLADVQGMLLTLLAASARYAATGITYTGVANPGRTVNAANKIIPALACKAWGVILAANSAVGTQDGEGGWTASVITNGAGVVRVRVTLAAPLLDANFKVDVSPFGPVGAGTGDFTALEDSTTRTVSTFDLVFKIAGVEREASNAGGIGFQFSLFGRR